VKTYDLLNTMPSLRQGCLRNRQNPVVHGLERHLFDLSSVCTRVFEEPIRVVSLANRPSHCRSRSSSGFFRLRAFPS
jgi:hypothetical protein